MLNLVFIAAATILTVFLRIIDAQELLSAGDGFHQQFQNLIQNRFICRIALFQNFQFQSLLEIAALLFFFLQFSRIDKISFTIICLIYLLSITSV